MKIAPNRFMRTALRRIPIFSTTAALVALSTVPSGLAATVYTYSGTATNSSPGDPWSTDPNWNSVPQSAADTTLAFTGTLAAATTHFTNNDLAAGFQLNRMTFTQVGPASGTAPVITLTGNPLEFVKDDLTGPTIAFSTTGTVKPIVVINNDIAIQDGAVLTVSNSDTNGSGTLAGVISGLGGLTKEGTGTVTLSNSNTFSGALQINGGNLVLSHGSALAGASSITVGSGSASTATLGLSGGITAGTGKSVTLYGPGVGNTGSLSSMSGDNTWAGDVVIGSNATRIGVAATSGGSLTLSGTISGTSAADVSIRSSSAAGTQMVTFSGNNTYEGATNIIIGTLSVGSINSTGANRVASSNLGAPTTTAAGTISLGSTGAATNNTLRYTGSGETTDRVINLLAGNTTGQNLTASIENAGTGLLKFSSSNTASGSQTKSLTLKGSGDGEFAGILSNGTGGAISLTKSGTGSWTLSGTNTYTGGTTLSGGTLVVKSTSSLGTGSLTVTGGTLDNGSGGTLVYSSSLLLAGGITLLDRANLTFSGASTNSTASNIITLGGTGRIFTLGAMTNTVAGNQTLTVNGAGNKLVLGGYVLSNSFTSRTVTLSGTGDIEITGAVSNGGTATGSALTYNGSGVLTLGGANTYRGATSLTGGTVNVTGSFDSTTGTDVTVNGSALNLNSSSALTKKTLVLTSGSVTLNTADAVSGAAITVNGGTFSHTVANAISGASTFTLNAAASTQQFNHATNYTGGTSIQAGTLQAGAAAVFSANSTITLANAASAGLVLNGFSQTIGGLSGGGATGGNTSMGTGTVTLTLGNNNASSTYSGVISSPGGTGNTGNLTKVGTGTQTLTAQNTHNGTTTVSGGTLTIGTSGGIANSSAIVLNGGNLSFSSAAPANIIADTASVTITGGVFNGTIGTTGAQALADTVASVTLSGTGFFNTGAGTFTTTGAAVMTGGSGASAFLGSSSQTTFQSLTVTGMNAAAGTSTNNAAGNAFTIQGNNATTQTKLAIGSGGLTLDGSILNLRKGAVASAKGSKISLEGDVTTTGSSASAIVQDLSDSSFNTGTVALELFSTTTGSVIRSFTVGANAPLTISVPVVNGSATSATINKQGAGTLTLSGANTFNGGVNLNAGTLQLGSTTALGATAGRLTIAGGTSLDSSVANLVNSAANTVTIGGDFTFAGTQSLDLGVGAISLGTTAGTSRAIQVNANTLALGGVISNGTTANSLVKNGAGTLSLANAANTFTGGVTLNAGTLRIGGAASLGTTAGTLTINGGSLDTTSGTAVATSNYPLVINGDFAFNGTGGLNLGNGTVSLGTAGGTSRSIHVAANTLTLGGVISNGTTATGITKTGAGTLSLGGINTYSGAIKIKAGTLSVNSIGAGTNSALGLNGVTEAIELGDNGSTGVLEYTGSAVNGVNSRVLSFVSGGTGEINVSNAIALATFSSSITGSGNLRKTGAGTLALSGTNNGGAFTGNIAVNAGVLEFTKAAAIPFTLTTSNTVVQSGAALAFAVGGTGFTQSEVLSLTSFGNATGGMLSGSLVGFDTSAAPSATFNFTGGLADVNGGANSIGLAKVGTASSVLVLSGANTYSGVTSVLGGVLSITNANALGTNQAGTVLATNTAINLSGGITISGESLSTVANSSGDTNPNFLVSASGDNQWTGNITGAAAVGGGGNFRISSSTGSNLTVAGNIAGTGSYPNTGFGGNGLVLAGAGAITVSGVISGTMELINTSSGSGTILTNTANTYVGATRIQNGILEVKSIGMQGSAGSLGAGTGTASAILFGSGTTAGTLRYTGTGSDTTDRQLTFADNGTGTFNASGGGLVKFQGTFSAGTGSKTMALTGTGAGEMASAIGNGTGGTVAVSKSGSGTWTLSGTNTYGGNTSISAGTLAVTQTASLSGYTTAGRVNVTGTGTLALNVGGSGEFDSTAVGAVLANASFASGTVLALDTTNAGGNFAYSAITGNHGLAKTGTGTLALSGSNTYSGNTMVAGGTLDLSGSVASGVTVNAGARLDGLGTVGGAAFINGTHLAGTGSIGSQSFSSSLTYNNGSVFTWELVSETEGIEGVDFDAVTVAGTMTVNSGSTFDLIIAGVNIESTFWDLPKSWDVFDAADFTGGFDNFRVYTSDLSPVDYSSCNGYFSFDNAGTLSWSGADAVPEPANALAGLLIAAGMFRRTRSRAAVARRA